MTGRQDADRHPQPNAHGDETERSSDHRTVVAMADTKNLYAWKWIDGYQANRPMLPSEWRVTATGTQRMLPWARAHLGHPRPLLPWEHRLGNDWRGIKGA